MKISKKLKHQFDRWCSIWFWPSENSNNPILSPNNFFSDDEKISDVVIELQSRHHFFHWELEFQEVFTKMATRDVTGFDVMIGNPPWDIQKPNSKEFFPTMTQFTELMIVIMLITEGMNCFNILLT